jgi:hypothetical protein
MSTEDERSVPRDLFSDPPATPAAGRYQYAAAAVGNAGSQFAPAAHAYAPYAPSPMTHGRTGPGPLRRTLSYVAVVWGGLSILGTALEWSWSSSYSVNHAYRGGQILGIVLAILLIRGGYLEIASNHLRRVRYVPWLMALEAVFLALAIAVLIALRSMYPPSVQIGFMNGCEANGGDGARCGCVLRWFESNRSLAAFIADFNGTAIEAGRTDMSEAVASCTSAK